MTGLQDLLDELDNRYPVNPVILSNIYFGNKYEENHVTPSGFGVGGKFFCYNHFIPSGFQGKFIY
jgi:hypothetical protein